MKDNFDNLKNYFSMKKIISDDRIAHMHGVAEWMYNQAEEYGCENKEKMYLLGLVHDIGYAFGKTGDDKKAADLFGCDSFLGRLVFAHGLTPNKYKELNNCSDSDIPNELVLLWTADMTIDIYGNDVGFDGRLKDIAERYGLSSSQYAECKEKILWLENRKENSFQKQ